jgi:outer membrane protein assembly factor BamD
LPDISARERRKRRKPRYNCSEEIQKALSLYERGRFGRVSTILSEVKLQCSGHQVIDTALYYNGKALLETKSEGEAKNEFQRLIQDFPNSPFYEEAHFLIGYCSYLESYPPDRDQSITREAIRELREFAEQFPQSEFADSARVYLKKCRGKLAQKEYNNARFYERIGEYEAAVIYYQSLIENYPESELILQAELNLAEALIHVNRTTEAKAVVDELSDETVHKEIRQRIIELYKKIEKKESSSAE